MSQIRRTDPCPASGFSAPPEAGTLPPVNDLRVGASAVAGGLVLAAHLGTVFVALPALVIVPVGVL
ncbi:hypothetical protein GCM10023235_50830 [Kitasatospora terrestris]|uniref:Uncharacterized protein n=1 Tax=Kitasatospora terrestris TaxID=258051 RepID=A0ABP9E8H2_9ACTN